MIDTALNWVLEHTAHAAMLIGLILMAAAAFGLAALALLWAAQDAGKYAWRLWRELSAIYRVHTMQYWFRRMEKDGTHVLRDAHKTGLEAQQAREAAQ